MKNKFYVFAILLFATIIQAKNVVQISIPKSGTHLLKKCICSLTSTDSVADEIDPTDLYIASPKKFKRKSEEEKHWKNHLFFNKGFEPYLNNPQNAFFFIYRDPRDQVISFAYWKLLHYKLLRDNLSKKVNDISFDEFIMELITSGEVYDDHPSCENVNDLYQKYIPWISHPNVCSLKFEKLVGPKGGGSLEAQLNSVEKIAKHLGMSLTKKQIRNKADTLFGEATTFRKGQIGSWKKHFNEDHKQAFKEIAGQLLIDLGYEKSFDW